MTYLASEMLLCLLGAALVGGILGWLWKRVTAGRRMEKMAVEHEHTLSVTEAELQRLSSELATQNKRASEAVAALQPLQARAGDAEARVITALMAKDASEAKVREQNAAVERLKETLAQREREIGQLESNISKLNPMVTEVNGLRSQAAAWERKSRQQEEQAKAHLGQRDNEITLLRGRVNELEALPAKLVERDARVRELDLKLRATEAAAQGRVQALESGVREAEGQAQTAARTLQQAERQTAAVLDERAGEIRLLRQRVADLEAMAARWAETDQALLTVRGELAQREAEWRATNPPLSMAAAVGAGLSSLAHGVAYPADNASGSAAGSAAGSAVDNSTGSAANAPTSGPFITVPPPDSAPLAPLTAADLQGCIQSLLFERPMQFLPKSAELTEESRQTLAEVAALMDQAPEVPVVIEGHTDNWGDPHTNWQLSLRRTEAVRSELTALQVAERRITCVGYGEARPIDDNSTPDGRWRNRRIEIRVRPGGV